MAADKPRFAMPDGSYPIDRCTGDNSVESAARLAHHSKKYSFEEIRRHVMRAKNALGCPDSVIPDSWSSGNGVRSVLPGAGARWIAQSMQVPPHARPDLEVRSFSANLEIREDGRTIVGIAVPYGEEAQIGRYTETWVQGAFADADPTKVPLVAPHPRDAGELPIGVTTELREEATGLWGAWHISDTAFGNDVLTLVRDGAVAGLSVGFVPVNGGDVWSADRKRVERRKALLDHVAVVRSPAYAGARVMALRAQVTTSRSSRLLLARLRSRR